MPTLATPRRRPAILAALAASTVLLLSACDKNPADPPLPRTDDAFPVAPSVVGDTSVPTATSVFSPTETPPPKESVPAAQSNEPLTDKKESAAMPLGGQANDHSAPKPAEAASAASAP